MDREGRALRIGTFAYCPVFLLVAASGALAGTTPIGTSSEPSLSTIFANLYPNGETLTTLSSIISDYQK